MRRIGLAGLVISGVVFVLLFLGSFDAYVTAWESSSDLWTQAQAVVSVIWNTVYQPLTYSLL